MHDDTIPPGLCQCGCGGLTKPYPRTTNSKGRIKGQLARYLPGHKGRRPTWIVDDASGCWLWMGAKTSDGYGRICVPGNRKELVHRWMYERIIGPIPEGLEIDHVADRGCVHRHCCNPAHLEAVTHLENVQRGRTGAPNREKTHCPQGHEYAGDNLKVDRHGRRGCVACQRETQRRYRERKARAT